jgi:hypothetical protein
MRRAIIGVRALLLVFVWAAAAPPTNAATGRDACKITQARSLVGKVRTKIRFVNKTRGVVRIYWLDYRGKRVYYNKLGPDARYVQRTWRTHPWVIVNREGRCIGYVLAPKSEYVIR